MKSLENYLRGILELNGIPLYYVVRSEKAVAHSLNEPETSFLSSQYEMVARAPILECGLRTVTFKTDMMKVWGLIYVITIDLDSLTYFKSSQSTRDERKAYRDLWNHFLGPDNVENMTSGAERIIITIH